MTLKPEQRAVPEETYVAKQKRLTQNDTNDRNINWISYVAIKATHYELLRRRDRGGRPSPSNAKRANEFTSPGIPARINIPPMTRVSSTPKNGARNSHCVIDHGTKPASSNGAITKNRAEPKMAVAFDTACIQFNPTFPTGAWILEFGLILSRKR
jgi:hypothetical protein